MQGPIVLRRRKRKGSTGLYYVQHCTECMCVVLIVSNRAGAYGL